MKARVAMCLRAPVLGLLMALCAGGVLPAAEIAVPSRPPNVVLVITDDQGYGDLGCTGNPVLKTPHLDRLHRESVRLTDFHVDPTCSPTRAALMTGRYAARVGVWHTVMGRHMPRPDERMLPQLLAEHGYATGIFGKWHLGDNPPFRPQDRGFQQTLIHGGGGIGQIPDAWRNDYFDDTYLRNGRPERFTGYCTDIFFREAMQFIAANRERPFFLYLATNAPHSPYRVPESWAAPYRAQVGGDAELATFYGMIANLDDNLGQLRAKLDELGLAENTLLIFMTDNGTARGATFADTRGNDGALKSGYNAGRRGRKGSPYEGGHRVPCFIYWPAGRLTGGRDVAGLAAHVDLLPTIADYCGLGAARVPAGDGISLRPVLTGAAAPDRERILITHHQEVPYPEKYRFGCVMQGAWRLILRNDRPQQPAPTFELYDLERDPAQAADVAASHPERLETLRAAYERWWGDLSGGFDRPAEIEIGDPRHDPVALTCFEWQGSQQWGQEAVRRGFEANGPWLVRVTHPGRFAIELRRWPAEVDAPITAAVDGGRALHIKQARVRIGAFDGRQEVAAEARAVVFEVPLEAGSHRLETWFTAGDGSARGAYYATVRRIGPPR